MLFRSIGEESVCVEGWFRSEKNRLAFLEFADGSKWDPEMIEKLLPGTGDIPTEGDDVLHGTPEADVIDGLGGNDTIYGGDGDDILIEGKENDELRGESGNDTYSWNLGDGRDLIVDSKGSNRLTFGPGIDWTMVTAAPYGTDLILNIGRDGEYVRIADWFADDSHKLEEIVFADGVVWSREEIDGKIGIVKGTEGNDTLYGTKKKDRKSHV